jgi:thiosulfate reductase cytochrome b subunit
MIWSGLLIYWANGAYKISWGDNVLIKFFPQGFFKSLNIPFRLAEGMNWHFLFIWLFFINGLLYITFTVVSGQWRYLLAKKNSFKEAWQVVLHDLHIKKYEPPFLKYNAAQRIAYTSIIVMGFGSLLTGLAIYKAVQFGAITWLCGGYEAARLEHLFLPLGMCFSFSFTLRRSLVRGIQGCSSEHPF